MLTLFRRKDRLCLVVIGILLVSSAAGLSAATARSVQGTVDEELARHWRTDYDLIVRAPAAVSQIEKEEGSVSSKFQSSHYPQHGISLYQLSQIRSIDGVEVAAPLAIVGPATVTGQVGVPLPYADLEPGIYREVVTVTDNNGIEELSTTYTRFFLVHDTLEQEFGTEYGIDTHSLYLAGLGSRADRFNARQFTINVVAVDFEAEAALYGLDRALVEGSLPEPGTYRGDHIVLPMVLSREYRPQGQATVKLAKLVDLEPTYQTVRRLAGTEQKVLVQGRQQPVREFDLDLSTLTLPELAEPIATSIYMAPEGLDYTLVDGELALVSRYLGGRFGLTRFGHDTTATFTFSGYNQWFRDVTTDEDIMSRFFARGTITYTYAGMFDPSLLNIMPSDSPVAAPLEIYRQGHEQVLAGLGGSEVAEGTYAKSLHPYDFVGAPVAGLVPIEALNVLGDVKIDSVRVRVSGVEDMSEASQVRIAYIAQQIRDRTGLHVDIMLGSSQQRQPVKLYSYGNQAWRKYVAMVEAALVEPMAEIERQIGAPVRLQFITYDEMLNERAAAGLEEQVPLVLLPRWFATMMGEEAGGTDLKVVMDNWLGPVFAELGYRDFSIDIPGNFHQEITILMPQYQIGEDEPRDLYGVVEQNWIKLGTQMRIYKETNRGTYWITLGLLAVGALFIGNTTYISAVGRIREYATLRALGWRRTTVFRVSLVETLLVALLAGAVTAGILTLIWFKSDRYLEAWLLLLVVPVVILTFLVGSIPPLVRTLFIRPLQGSRQGELKGTTHMGGPGPLGFVVRGPFSRPGRTVVTTLAMVIPSSVLALMFFIYFGIQMVLGETLLGEYLAVELRGYHFVLNALVFAVAALAVTDTLLINLQERQKEMGLLKAVGWRNSTVFGLLFWEGVGLGLIGGIVGTSAAAWGYIQIFGMLPPSLWMSGPLLALVPAAVGGLAAVVPALRAARIPAAQVIREE